MSQHFLPRNLRQQTDDGSALVSQKDLIGLKGPIVILGESGMGKTELLRWLADTTGHAFSTARKLKNSKGDRARLMGTASTIVIDALDELSVRGEGDAVDLVLQRLGDLEYPDFILSCRVADWRSATNASAIAEQYDKEKLLVFHLEPLTADDIRQLLAAEFAGDFERANAIIRHFREANLDGLLNNPQTLKMITTVARKGDLPTSRAELFKRAVEELRREHRDDRADLQVDEEAALDAAGAAFACLILTGSDALVLQDANPSEDEITLAEVAALPGAHRLKEVLASRLFATAGTASRFSYWHRSIGEYLGSRWLARQANTVPRRKRLLALLQAHGGVPASLRGLHAWLAHHDPHLAPVVIAVDPMAVIEYGEADVLDSTQAGHLLEALKVLAERNPYFHRSWQRYSLKGLAKPALIEPLRALLNDATYEPTLRLLILDAVANSTVAEALRHELRRIGMDASELLTHRFSAIEALRKIGGENWAATVAHLHGRKSENDIRLALELMEATGSGSYSDAEIVGVAIAYAQHERLSGYVLNRFIDELPAERLDVILDELATQVSIIGDRHNRRGNRELTDLGYRLIGRRLASGPAEATHLWAWLKPFDEQHGYGRDEGKKVHDLIAQDDVLRRAGQRLVLLDEPGPKTVWERAYRLTSRSPGFRPTSEDVLVLLLLLATANHKDERWREVITLTMHSETEGVEVREAAKRFVANRPDMLAWIDKLAHPEKPDWQVRQDNEQRRRAMKQAMEWQEHRRIYRESIEAMRRGQAGAVLCPAQVYLGLSFEIASDAEPSDRLTTWLGQELAQAALDGFEAFLQSDQSPTAFRVAENHGQSLATPKVCIIVAAMIERVRSDLGLDDVSDDRLTTTFYSLQLSPSSDVGRTSGLWDIVDSHMKVRNLKQAALQLWIEAQLKHARVYIDQLHLIMRDPEEVVYACEQAVEWLERYPEMTIDAEKDMIDRLIQSRRQNDLRNLARSRTISTLSVERLGLWNAVSFIADFDVQRDRLTKLAHSEPSWIWAIRRRIGGFRGNGISPLLSVEQLVWLVQTFRPLFPVVEHPNGVVNGDEMPWDASEFLTSVASRLADTTTDAAAVGLRDLVQMATDGYTRVFRSLVAEQQRKSTEARYRSPRLSEIRAIVEGQSPRTAVDLQATLLGLLEDVQRRISADPADSWRGFYNDAKVPHGEERCRDYLLTMLGVYPEKIDLQPEGHMAQDNRADIMAQVAGLRLPIEVKGQWHPDLWTAADSQLDCLYASDYAAERRGIYLVFWFGEDVLSNKKTRSQGRATTQPSAPEELRRRLIAASQAAQEGVLRFLYSIVRFLQPPESEQ